jgi:transitional endoplasmic reticulum ATPase
MLVRALAAEVKFNALMLKPENILSKYVGESEAKLKKFFALVKVLAPVLVFFDEVDQSDMASRGNDSGNPVARNLFNQMLQAMSDETTRGKMVMIFASNRPDLVDEALQRFGRIDATIPILLPDDEARKSIIRVQAQTQTVGIEAEAVTLLAQRTEDCSPADLAKFVEKARKLARRRARSASITVKEVEAALRYITPSTPRTATSYIRAAIRACTDRELLPPGYVRYLEEDAAESSAAETPEPSSPLRSGRSRW